MINATKLTRRDMSELKIVVNGAGSAGIAVSKLLISRGVGDLILCDRAGAITADRKERMDRYKMQIGEVSNKDQKSGSLADVLVGADVFIGLSAPNTVTQDMVRSMAKNPLIFALANPNPEINPIDAHEAGAFAVATGRSDYPNQVNNSLAFPGVFRGALDVRATQISDEMKIAAAEAIARLVPNAKLAPEFLIPDSLDLRVAPRVAAAVARTAQENGLARLEMDPVEIEARTRDMVYEGLMLP
jgi:malate dehydrogenase (oxaloacetate-decarboxylating)